MSGKALWWKKEKASYVGWKMLVWEGVGELTGSTSYVMAYVPIIWLSLLGP